MIRPIDHTEFSRDLRMAFVEYCLSPSDFLRPARCCAESQSVDRRRGSPGGKGREGNGHGHLRSGGNDEQFARHG